MTRRGRGAELTVAGAGPAGGGWWRQEECSSRSSSRRTRSKLGSRSVGGGGGPLGRAGAVAAPWNGGAPGRGGYEVAYGPEEAGRYGPE